MNVLTKVIKKMFYITIVLRKSLSIGAIGTVASSIDKLTVKRLRDTIKNCSSFYY